MRYCYRYVRLGPLLLEACHLKWRWLLFNGLFNRYYCMRWILIYNDSYFTRENKFYCIFEIWSPFLKTFFPPKKIVYLQHKNLRIGFSAILSWGSLLLYRFITFFFAEDHWVGQTNGNQSGWADLEYKEDLTAVLTICNFMCCTRQNSLLFRNSLYCNSSVSENLHID